jgi:hypothetical protein
MDTMGAILKRAEGYAKAPSKHERGSAPASGPVQLPIWSNDVRGLPNALARSAVFGMANRNAARRRFDDEQIATMEGLSLRFTGEELRQDDEDVFMQVMHLGRLQPLGRPVAFSGYGLLKALGVTAGSANYRRVVANLERLQGARVKIMREGKDGEGKLRDFYTGQLLASFSRRERDDSTRSQWAVLLDPTIVRLFGPDDYTLLNFDQRLQLSPLGKWLHSFYHTHRHPFPMKVETIHRLCRSDSKQLFHFRARLRASLEELKHCGFLKSWRVDTSDLVVVERNPPRIKDIMSTAG